MSSLNLLLNTLKECKNLNSLRKQTRDVGGSELAGLRMSLGFFGTQSL